MAPLRRADVTAIVLAGGAGARLGGDKPAAAFAGTTLLAATVARVSGAAGGCLVVGKRAARLEAALGGERATIVEDETPEHHPLAGVVAGLRQAQTSWALVVTCDAPLVAPELVAALAALAEGDAAAVVARWGDRVQPFPGLYRRAAVLPLASRLLATGGSVRALFASVDARQLDEADVRAVDPDGLSFLDADTPDALAALARRAAR